MLYLYGDSGTMYEYIHLNNDVTMKNDNRGKCVAGMSYAKGLKDGAKVTAGQQIGYLGDSGDANGIHRTCTSRCIRTAARPSTRTRTSRPRSTCSSSRRSGTPFTLALTGTVVMRPTRR